MATWADRLRTSSGSTPSTASVHLPLRAVADPTRLTRSGSESFAAVNESPRSPLVPLIRLRQDADSAVSPTPPSGDALRRRCAMTQLDVGVWVDVMRFLDYRDVCHVGSTCRGLWTLHLTDHVWHDQERYLRRDLALMRGGAEALDIATSESTLPSPSPTNFETSSLKGIPNPMPAAHRYLQFKRLKVLAAKDIRREWDFRELIGRLHANDRQRVFFMNQPDMQPREGVMTRVLTGAVVGHRIRKSEIRLFDAARVGGKPLRPSQILTVCDDVAANVDGRIPVLETTDAQDDPSILQRLHLGLAARQAGDNLLFSLGPRIKLVEVSREEAETVLQDELVVRVPLYANLIENFVIDPQTTRYFVGPELCRSGERVGMIVVDDLRMLLVLCTE